MRTTRSDLTERIRRADEICADARVFFRKAEEIQEHLKRRSNRNIVVFSCSIVCAGILPYVSVFFASMVGIKPYVSVFGSLAVVAVATVASFICNNIRSKDALMKEADDCRREGERVLAEHAEALEFIPEEYRTSKAIRAMRREVEKGKAASLNDLILAYLREETAEMSKNNEKLRREAERIRARTESIRQAEVDFLTAAVMLNYTSPKKK